jgi:hypothetical protein
LHPVGKLPTAVYWRRRAVLLILLLVVLGGGAWLTLTLLSARDSASGASSAATTGPAPALDRVVPSLEAVTTPTPPLMTSSAAPAVAATPTVPAPVPGGPCTDDMISLEVRTPGTAAVGSKPTFDLLVTNVSAVPCVRALDKGLQELLLFDSAGNRIWGSNDCFPEASSDARTLAPGEVVTIPVVWGGLTSEPTCTAARSNPAAGTYVVRGRLDTKISPDASLTLA